MDVEKHIKKIEMDIAEIKLGLEKLENKLSEMHSDMQVMGFGKGAGKEIKAKKRP